MMSGKYVKRKSRFGFLTARTQNSAAAPLGRGSVPASALRTNKKRNSKEDEGWCRRRTLGYFVNNRWRNSMPDCAISGSSLGSHRVIIGELKSWI